MTNFSTRSIINTQLNGVLELHPAETKIVFRTQEPELDNASVGNVFTKEVESRCLVYQNQAFLIVLTCCSKCSQDVYSSIIRNTGELVIAG